jgi:hypothetical protein
VNTSDPLRQQLTPCIELRFPGFEKHYEVINPRLRAYAFERMDGRTWYTEFARRVLSAQSERSFLPIYRMGDGEYSFALGGRPSERLPLWKLPPRQLLKRLRDRLGGRDGYHRSGSAEYGFEEYSAIESEQIKDAFTICLRQVASKGALLLGLHDRPIYQAYIPAILDWFDANEICVHRHNYYHVYAMYSLMHGPDRFALLKDRRVLVVTGLSPEKQQGIEAGLLRVGAADVQFLPVSLNKAMLDVLDLSSVRVPVDVALVGAGVGSVNVLVQLEPLKTPCLDVGFALSTLVNPELRWNRPFCVPDDEFNLKKVRWLK